MLKRAAISGLVFMVLSTTGIRSNAASQVFQVPFQYSVKHHVILLHGHVENKPALLILDTGCAHTIVKPELVGIVLSEFSPTKLNSFGVGFQGDAIGREITLELGTWKREKFTVSVMDLRQVLSAYPERPDGVLGLDFLEQFSSVTIDLKAKTISLG